MGRNRRKGQLAAKLVREVNRSHCPNNPVRVEFHAVDIKNLTAVHGLFGYIAKEWTNRLDCLLLTAGIPGITMVSNATIFATNFPVYVDIGYISGLGMWE